jgi:hypothetical protein
MQEEGCSNPNIFTVCLETSDSQWDLCCSLHVYANEDAGLCFEGITDYRTILDY